MNKQTVVIEGGKNIRIAQRINDGKEGSEQTMTVKKGKRNNNNSSEIYIRVRELRQE